MEIQNLDAAIASFGSIIDREPERLKTITTQEAPDRIVGFRHYDSGLIAPLVKEKPNQVEIKVREQRVVSHSPTSEQMARQKIVEQILLKVQDGDWVLSGEQARILTRHAMRRVDIYNLPDVCQLFVAQIKKTGRADFIKPVFEVLAKESDRLFQRSYNHVNELGWRYTSHASFAASKKEYTDNVVMLMTASP